MTSLVAWLAASFSAALIGGIATSRSVGTWYAALNKPLWNPPGWLFGPVWSVLYTMMGVAAWIVWRTDHPVKPLAIGLFVAQLALNALWSWLFFGWRMPGFAFLEIAILWVVILATAVSFWRISPVAGWLLVPYLAWVGFASVLNFTIWRMNP